MISSALQELLTCLPHWILKQAQCTLLVGENLPLFMHIDTQPRTLLSISTHTHMHIHHPGALGSSVTALTGHRPPPFLTPPPSSPPPHSECKGAQLSGDFCFSPFSSFCTSSCSPLSFRLSFCLHHILFQLSLKNKTQNASHEWLKCRRIESSGCFDVTEHLQLTAASDSLEFNEVCY